MAVVQLQFQKDVDDPLKPLRDDISDGYFGMFKVERQLDLNPSMFDPLGGGGRGGGNSIVFHLSFLTHSACKYDVT